MFVKDDDLVLRGRANFHQKYVDIFSPVNSEADRLALIRRFLPSVLNSLKNNPVWEISFNDEGFRDDNFPREKYPSVFRIVCLGDSWTVGSNVNQNESYPYILEELLNKEYPGAKFEVFNLGVFGYTSYQGSKLMDRALELKPDLMVVGFAMNEAQMTAHKEYVETTKKKPYFFS